MVSTWVLHMLTSDQLQICVNSASKFLGLIAEHLTYIYQLVIEVRPGCITMTHSLSEKVGIGRGKMNLREKVVAVEVSAQGHANCVR